MVTSPQPLPSNSNGDTQAQYSAIVASVKEARTSGALTPEFADALIAALNDKKTPSKHAELLAAAWKVIEQLIQDRQDIEFLLDIGDWARAVVSPMWERKDSHAKAHQKDLLAHFKKKGCTDVKADALAKHHSQYPFLGDHVNHQLCQRMMTEESVVKKWREDGENPSAIPDTPFLDRVAFLCQRESISAGLFVKLVKTYAKRNAFAHRPPPRMADFVLAGSQGQPAENRIDWLGMRTECAQRKPSCQAEFESARIRKNEKDFFQAVIDSYWLSLGSSWHDQVVIPTATAKKEAQRVCKRHDKLPIAVTAWQGPALPYHHGKWNFLN